MEKNFNNQFNSINSINNGSNRKDRFHNSSGINIPINRIQKQRNDTIKTEAYHLNTKGELLLDISKNQLKWTAKGEKSEKFLKKYEGEDSFTFNKDDIKNVLKSTKEDRELLRFEIKTSKGVNSYIFSFQGKDHKIMRDKFADMLKTDFDKYYKKQFQLLPIEYQKRICLLLKNKYLCLLFRKVLSCNNDIERAWNFIKFKYPGDININLGKNKIQLSRDEELIMLIQKKYNKTKLINSDSNIYKDYIQKKNLDNEDEYWKEFMDRQRINNTYIVGGYKPSAIEEKYDDEKQNGNIFEGLEKDKYYYDCYETNYLYHNDNENENMKKEREKLIDQIKVLNDYSINKIKDINYFTYNSFCMNANVGVKKKVKNKINKRKSIGNLNISNNEDVMMEEEKIEIDIKNLNYTTKLSKEELENKLNNMKIEYNNYKKEKDNSYIKTMKVINNENFNYYNKIKFEPSLIEIEKILFPLLNQIFLIKDLAFEQKYQQKFDNLILEKMRKQDERASPKRHESEKSIKFKFDHFNQEIRSIFEKFKKSREKIEINEGDVDIRLIYSFLFETAQKTIDGLIAK